MNRSLRLFSVLVIILAASLFSCESKQKAEVGKAGETQQTAGPVVDVSKQMPLQGPYKKEQGNCWIVGLPQYENSSDNMKEGTRSKLVLYEDGKPLGPAHSLHDDIRTKGGGRYSHWTDTLYFSASDNSDPNKNGRKYSFSN